MAKWYSKRYFSGQISDKDKRPKKSDKNKKKVQGFLTFNQRRILQKYGALAGRKMISTKKMTNVTSMDVLGMVPPAMAKELKNEYARLIPDVKRPEASTSQLDCTLSFDIDVGGELPSPGFIKCEKNDELSVKNEVKKESTDENLGSGCYSSFSKGSYSLHQKGSIKIEKEDTPEDATQGNDSSHQAERIKMEKEDTTEDATQAGNESDDECVIIDVIRVKNENT